MLNEYRITVENSSGDGTGKYLTKWYTLGARNLLHREEGPAVINEQTTQGLLYHGYWRHGQLHREDGPAAIWFEQDGSVSNRMLAKYYLDGQLYEKEAFEAEVAKRNAPPVKELTVAEISKLLGYEVKVTK